MNLTRASVLAGLALTLLPALPVAAAKPPRVPTGHPPVSVPERPAQPRGHPDDAPQQTFTDATTGGNTGAEADVATPDALVHAYYASLSGPVGQARDWDRFRALFLPDAAVITPRPDAAGETLVARITVDQFIKSNNRYFVGGGYCETPVGGRTFVFGAIAHTVSAYEARRGGPDAPPYLRGVNSFQLVRSGDRWWIASVMWDIERPNGPAIPPSLLAAPATP